MTAVISYLYDSNDEVYGFTYNNKTYIYVKTIQGDVGGIINATDNISCIGMIYDAWGNVTYDYNEELDSLGKLEAMIVAAMNSIMYRGYFYDVETGLYYLQSRYYDPETGRFINADDTAYIGYDSSPLSTNIFAYCANNPIKYVDYGGNSIFNNPNTFGVFGFYRVGYNLWSTVYNPWQKKAGYCDLYDKAAWLAGIRIDWLIGEFDYRGEHWRIELWKGRYGITVGAEVGIYYKPKKVAGQILYKCYDNMVHMTFDLYYVKNRNGEYYGYPYISREDRHWWLTGFRFSGDLTKAGIFTRNLLMLATIDFADFKKYYNNDLKEYNFNPVEMANAFVRKLKTKKGSTFKFTVCEDGTVLICWVNKYDKTITLV